MGPFRPEDPGPGGEGPPKGALPTVPRPSMTDPFLLLPSCLPGLTLTDAISSWFLYSQDFSKRKKQYKVLA